MDLKAGKQWPMKLLILGITLVAFSNYFVLHGITSTNADDNLKQENKDLSFSTEIPLSVQSIAKPDIASNVQQQPIPEAPAVNISCYQFKTSNITVSFPMIPQFIIIGTHKGGTSALWKILRDHPNLLTSDRSEAHFFDIKMKLFLETRSQQLLNDENAICRTRRAYMSCFNANRMQQLQDPSHPRKWAFEKTPSYMAYPRLPRAVKIVTPWAKLVVSLRDPVARLWSGANIPAEELATAVDKQLELLRKWKLSNAPCFADYRAMPGNYTDKDFELQWSIDAKRPAVPPVGPNLMGNGLYRGLYAYQLVQWTEHFSLGKDILVIDNSMIRDGMQNVVTKILNFAGIPNLAINETRAQEDHAPNRNHKRHEFSEADPVLVEYLKRFYRPYNAQLYDLLGDSWTTRWD